MRCFRAKNADGAGRKNRKAPIPCKLQKIENTVDPHVPGGKRLAFGRRRQNGSQIENGIYSEAVDRTEKRIMVKEIDDSGGAVRKVCGQRCASARTGHDEVAFFTECWHKFRADLTGRADDKDVLHEMTSDGAAAHEPQLPRAAAGAKKQRAA